ncbi:MAG: phosphatase PAP2 family protein [Phycisphaerales bacterium]
MIMARGEVLERIERASAPPVAAPDDPADATDDKPLPAGAAIRPSSRVRDGLTVLGALAGYLLLSLLDRAAYKALFVGHANLNWLEDAEWYKLLRVLGSLWTWSLIALVFIAHDTGRALDAGARREGRGPAWERGVRIFAAAVVAGLLAELAKVVVGRWRPIDTDGYYVYSGLVAGFLKPANGMPSSHAAVAFGSMLTLAVYVPRATGILIAAAAGCCLSRVLSGAHFVTDTFVGAAFGYAGARLVRPGGWSGALVAPAAS